MSKIIKTVSPEHLHRIMDSGVDVQLIDVRTPGEYREAHVPFAKNTPLDRLSEVSNGTEPLYIICQGGQRAMKACEKLLSMGVQNAIVVEGGTKAWIDAGYAVTRGKKAISLERQVRIAAGALAFVGAILALFVHPLFAVLSAVIGAGLVFAGLTDNCGMGMLLSRMPWNRSPKSVGSCSL